MPIARGLLLAEQLVLVGLGPRGERIARTPFSAAQDVIRMLARAGIEDFATVPFTAGRGIRLATVVEQQLGGFMAGLLRADHAGAIRRITICIADGRRYASLRRAMTRAMPALRTRDLQLVVDECAPPDTPTATQVSR